MTQSRETLKLFIVLMMSCLVVSCAGNAPVRQATENPTITEFFKTVDTYCKPGPKSPEELEARLAAAPELTVIPSQVQATYVHEVNGVQYGIFVEKGGCAVDLMRVGHVDEDAMTYRQFYAALKQRKYELSGGIIMSGLDVNKHYVSPADLNTLLYIPDRDKYGRQYLSMYTEIFKKTKHSLFPRDGVYVRHGLSKVRMPGSRDEPRRPRKTDSPVRQSRDIVDMGSRQLADGRIGYTNEIPVLSQMSGSMYRLCNSGEEVKKYLDSVDAFEAGNQTYLDMGMDQFADRHNVKAILYLGTIAQTLSELGEFDRAVRFYRRIEQYYEINLRHDDPAGYYLFARDYSTALYDTGDTGEAASWYRKAKKMELRLRQSRPKPVNYLQVKRCDIAVNNDFLFDEKVKSRNYRTRKGDVRVNVELVEPVTTLRSVGGKYNIAFETDGDQLELINIRYRNSMQSMWSTANRTIWGVRSSEFDRSHPLSFMDWPVLMELNPGASVFTVEFTLRDKDEKLQTISLQFKYNDATSAFAPIM